MLRHVRILQPCFKAPIVAAVILVLAIQMMVSGQAVDPLSQQYADKRVELEYLRFLVTSKQIDNNEYRTRVNQTNLDIRNLGAQIAKRPRDQQAKLTQEQESIFQVKILPLRDQWARETQEKLQAERAAAQARDVQIRAELTADADVAGKLQGARTLLKEKQQRQEISQAEFASLDREAEQRVFALQRKFDEYGANYGRLFTQTVAQIAAKVAADTRLQQRLDDTNSEVGRDAHTATDLTLSVKRNEIFAAKRAITPQEHQASNTQLLAQLNTLNAKYANGQFAVDYRDRVNRLVQAGVAARTPQWTAEADTAVQTALASQQAAQAAALANQQAAQATALANQQAAQANTAGGGPPAPRRNTANSVGPASTPYNPPTMTFPEDNGPDTMQSIRDGIAAIVGTIINLGILGGIGFLIVMKIKNSPRREMRRTNKEALEAIGGTDPIAREQRILDAFDNENTTFKFSVHNRNRGQKMYFVLLRNMKSMKTADREALRIAFLLYNRKLLDNEHFNWIRFAMAYAAGQTDPSEWKPLGLIRPITSRFRRQKGQLVIARGALQDYAQRTLTGVEIETWSIGVVNKLAVQNPQDSLFQEMQRRLLEGAYWMGKSDIKKSAFAPANSKYAVRFGILDGSDAELAYSGEGSIMTIAPPRSGKTQCNVFPNLLTWPGPAVVLDVKGEIYAGTAKWRRENVGPVIKFAPLDPANSAHYNPLAMVRRDSLYVWEDARFVADMMIVPNKETKDPFWENRAREILTAIIADLAYWNAPDARPVSKVLTLINRGGWKEFVQRLQTNPEVSAMCDEGNSLAQTEAKTLDGILQTAKSSLSAWVGERINQVTKKSDWEPTDLRNGQNPTIYVCLKPNEIEAYVSLLRVFIAQHIRGLTSELPSRDAAPILFVLDEMPRLGRMPPIEEALEIGSQYGIRLWMFAQSLGQLQAAYPNADGMIGSCAVRSFMNPSAHDGTAEMVANQIGFKDGEQHGGKGEDALKRTDQLIVKPSDLAGPKFKELQIVMAVGSKPARVRKMYAYQSEQLKTRMAAG